MKRFIFIAIILFSGISFCDLTFSPINVRSVELVAGVTHTEFNAATNALWTANDYQIISYPAGTTSLTLKSSTIVSCSLSTNASTRACFCSVALDFSGATDRSGDAALYLICSGTGAITSVSFVDGGSVRTSLLADDDWSVLKDGENLIYFTRLQSGVILPTRKSQE